MKHLTYSLAPVVKEALCSACQTCKMPSCDVCTLRTLSGYDTFLAAGDTLEYYTHGPAIKKGPGDGGVRDEDIRKVSSREWLYQHRSALPIEACTAQLVTTLAVVYVPEKTYIPKEDRVSKASRLIVLVQDEEGNLYVANVRHELNALVGYCTNDRTAKLGATSWVLEVSNGSIEWESLRDWFAMSDLPLK